VELRRAKRSPQMVMHAIDCTGQVLIYVFGAQRRSILQLKVLLETVWHQTIPRGWGAYQRYLKSEKHEVGKRRPVTCIERKRLGAEKRESNVTSLEDHFRLVEPDDRFGNWTFINQILNHSPI